MMEGWRKMEERREKDGEIEVMDRDGGVDGWMDSSAVNSRRC